jgi:hypothetical protein
MCGLIATGQMPALFAQESENPMATALKRLSEKPSFYCNLDAFTPKERAKHEKLGTKIWQARTATKELDDGYAFQLNQTRQRAPTLE